MDIRLRLKHFNLEPSSSVLAKSFRGFQPLNRAAVSSVHSRNIFECRLLPHTEAIDKDISAFVEP